MHHQPFDNEIEARNFAWEQLLRKQVVNVQPITDTESGIITWQVNWKPVVYQPGEYMEVLG